AGRRVKQCGSERVQIARTIDGAAELFERHVPKCSYQRRAVSARSTDAAGASEVHQDEAAIGPQQQVVWFDIAVNERRRPVVKVREDGQHLASDGEELGFWQRPAVNAGCERLALNELGSQVEAQTDAITFGEVANEAGNRLVIQRLER